MHGEKFMTHVQLALTRKLAIQVFDQGLSGRDLIQVGALILIAPHIKPSFTINHIKTRSSP